MPYHGTWNVLCHDRSHTIESNVMTQGKDGARGPDGDLTDWMTAWADSIGRHPLAPLDASAVQATTLDWVIRDAVTDALAPWLRAPIDPNDDSLLVYSVEIVAGNHMTWANLPEFSATPLPLTDANDIRPAAVLRLALQDRINRGLPIPGGSAGWTGTSSQSLDDRSCRILRLHQSRLNLGHSVQKFRASLSVTEDYFEAMLKLEDNIVPTDTISRCLRTARDLLRHDVSATSGRSQRR
jgi:hypothetical protein